MKHKVQTISEEIAKRLAALRGIEAIALAETFGEEVSDPYFLFSLDVYYRAGLPKPAEREALFDDSGAFESSSVADKDRFFLEGLPVRIEYKSVARIDEILGDFEGNLGVFRQTGTYMLNRIASAEVLVKNGPWIDEVRSNLNALPERFWALITSASEAAMEHSLSDLAAAVARDDAYFFLVSAAGFVKSLCGALFAVNRRFEPSGRVLAERILGLPRLPEGFAARFESFLGDDAEFPPQRKREVAELLARSVLHMA